MGTNRTTFSASPESASAEHRGAGTAPSEDDRIRIALREAGVDPVSWRYTLEKCRNLRTFLMGWWDTAVIRNILLDGQTEDVELATMVAAKELVILNGDIKVIDIGEFSLLYRCGKPFPEAWYTEPVIAFTGMYPLEPLPTHPLMDGGFQAAIEGFVKNRLRRGYRHIMAWNSNTPRIVSPELRSLLIRSGSVFKIMPGDVA